MLLCPPRKVSARSPARRTSLRFTDTFTGRQIDAGELRQHAVIPGTGHWLAEEAPRKR
jgi:hypothetical protein